MPVDRFLQTSFASGEFDPLLNSREDVAFYYTSAQLMENVVPLPQGGAKRREGLRYAGKQRGPLTDVVISGYTYAAPNGGTAANLISATSASTLLTTGAINTATEYVVATIDAGAAIRVTASDITARLVGGTISTGALALQSSDDATTYTTRSSIVIGTSFFDRRFAGLADADLGTHRYWRVIFLNPDADDYSTDEIEVYGFGITQETGYSQTSATAGNVKLRHITTGITSEFYIAITAGNVDIYSSAGAWLAAVAIPHDNAAIPDLKTSQQRDALVIYHPDYPPYLVQRLESIDTEWRSGAFVFETVAQFPFEDSTTGGQNEIQELRFTSMTAGDRYLFEFNGEYSDEIAWNGTPATNITRINDALEGLVDITSVTVTNPTGNIYVIEFDGVDAKTFFATIVTDILDGTGTVTNSRKQAGKPDQEDLFSTTRGYPRCGTFYQGRHWMGGFRGRPDVIVGSRAGNFGDFKEDADPISTSPLVLAPNIDEQVTVENIYAGRNLQIFTSSAEIYVPSEPITPDTIALKVSSRRGASPLCQAVDVQGGTMFIDRNGTALREYLFLEAEQSYTAEPVSTLGGHLVQQPSDIALRRSVNTVDPTLIYLVNQGRDRNFDLVPAASITIDRAQQVTAFARIESSGGLFKSVAATQGGGAAFAVARELAGNEWTFIEIHDADHMSDHAEEVANPDVDSFTATAAQTVFTYTFANPLDDNDIAVFSRVDANDIWRRVDPADYTLDTGSKTITLTTGLDLGHLLSICKRATSFTTTLDTLNGIECYVHGDGRPLGAHTPAANAVAISGDEGFFFNARIGLRMVPVVVLQPYKGKGGQSPTMQRQRIFRALINVERTASLAVSMNGRTPRNIPFADYDVGIYDIDLEDSLFTGVKRLSGIGSWEIEPSIRITQNEPAPWLLRSIAYDIRF